MVMMSGSNVTVRGRSVLGSRGPARRTFALRAVRMLVVAAFVALALLAGGVVGRLGGAGTRTPSVAPPDRPVIPRPAPARDAREWPARDVPRRV